MRSRKLRSFAAVAVCVTAFAVELPAVAAATHAPSHPGAQAHAALGPPLGYYEQSVRTCIHHPYLFYHNKSFYRACKQDMRIVAGEREGFCRILGVASVLAGFIPVGRVVQIGVALFGATVYAVC